jgi:hypothetical protein
MGKKPKPPAAKAPPRYKVQVGPTRPAPGSRLKPSKGAKR